MEPERQGSGWRNPPRRCEMVETKIFAAGEGLHLEAEGHAGTAPRGENLVCAGVSTLVQTLAEAVWRLYEQGMLERVPRVEMEEGRAEIIAVPKEAFRGICLVAFWQCQVGLGLLAEQFEDCVEMKEVLRV